MPKLRISLANKCQLMFGAAVLLIVFAALAVPWLRMRALVDEGQRQIARKLADAWLDDMIQLGGALRATDPDVAGERRALRMRLIDQQTLEIEAAADSFVARALEQFETWPGKRDVFTAVRDDQGRLLYRYARAIRQRDLEPARGGFEAKLPPTQVANPLRAILLIEMRAEWAQAQVRTNRMYLAAAGLLAVVLAIAVFWLITTRIILSPVRVLRDTAEQVANGDLNTRADVNTGDEFEQLSDTFNQMMANMIRSQNKLRELNKQLDLKLGELAQSNVSLYEANRLKGDFLANVSHELRTPLNSIIGFAEVLTETLPDDGDPQRAKHRRYARNILTSSRSLLQMISELLDLAKIEAGRVDLNVDRMVVAEVCESLLNLIQPQAERKGIELKLNVARDVPVIQTDPGKFQQIVFNFLSNAVKFTPAGGTIELGAAAERSEGGEPAGVRVWVTDTGPGIPADRQQEIFDKFRQLDATETKQHGGTGLGLAISQELARVLQGRIELHSEEGRGATFTLVLPPAIEQRTSEPLMPSVRR